MAAADGLWWVYVLHCTGHRYYVGASSDVERRYRAHVSGHAALFTRAHPPAALVGALPVGSRSQAMALERKVKRWRPERKVARFAPHQAAWSRCGMTGWAGGSSMATDLHTALAVIARIDADRRTYELKAWTACTAVAPDLIELLAQTGIDPDAAAAWLCTPNTYLFGRCPAAAVADGQTAEVMSMVVRLIHDIP